MISLVSLLLINSFISVLLHQRFINTHPPYRHDLSPLRPPPPAPPPLKSSLLCWSACRWLFFQTFLCAFTHIDYINIDPLFTCVLCFIIFPKRTKILFHFESFFFNFKGSITIVVDASVVIKLELKREREREVYGARLDALLCLPRSIDLLLHNLSKV